MMSVETYTDVVIPKILYMALLITLVLCLSLMTGKVSRFLSHRYMLSLGKLAFGMYLLHQPTIRVMRYFFEDYYLSIGATDYVALVANTLGVFAVIIFLAYLAHIFVETPARYYIREKLGIKTVEVRL